MNKIQTLSISVLFIISQMVMAETDSTEKQQPAFANDKDSLSYAMGVAYSHQLTQQQLDKELNVKVFLQAVEDALTQRDLKLSPAEVSQALDNYQQKKQTETEQLAKRNKAASDKYFAENAKKKSVKTLASGLQYKELKKGDGEKPTLDSIISVNYRGSLLDGTEFDSSGKNGPIEFPLKQALKGWQEVLPEMTVGSKWKFAVPPSLAYGEQGAGLIEPNATLLYEVELVAIVDPKAAEQAKTNKQPVIEKKKATNN